MQIRLTVVDPLGPHASVGGRAASCDVLVTAPAGTALAAVASALAAALPGGEGTGSGQVVLYAGAQRLDAQRSTLGEPPLTDGAVLCLGAPGEPDPHTEPADVPAQLHVVAGPDAGGVHLLHGGQIQLGRSADADVALDDPDVSRMHCAVTVASDGHVSVADLGSTNGTTLDGARVGTRPVRLVPGALLRIGESALRLVPAPEGAQARVATTPDGEGHVRLSGARALPSATGTGAGDEMAHARVADGEQGHAPLGGAGKAAGSPRTAGGTDDPPHPTGATDAPARTTGRAGTHPRTMGGTDGAPHPTPTTDAPAHTTGRAGTHPRTAGGTDGPPHTAGAPDGFASGSGRPDGPARGAGTDGWDGPAARTHHAYGTADQGTGAAPAEPRQVPGQGGAPRIESHGTGPTAGPPRPAPAGGDTHGGAYGAGTHGGAYGTGIHGGADGSDDAPGPHTGAGTGTGTGTVTGRKGTPLRGTDVPQGVRRRGGLGAWARRLAGGRGSTQDTTGSGTYAYDEQPAGPAPTVPAGTSRAPETWPDPASLLLTALGPGPRLWERGPGHPEALTVRLGTADRVAPGGDAPLPAVPVTAGLREVGALGLAGPRARLSGLARAVLAQLAALHSPDVLEIVLISADRSRPLDERAAEWSWLGWLPQLRPGHGQDCRLLLAYDREQATARAHELLRRLEDHLTDTRTGTRPTAPTGTIPAQPAAPSQGAHGAGPAAGPAAGRTAATGTTPTAAPTQAAHRADPAADPATGPTAGRTAATGAPTAEPTQAAHPADPATGPAAGRAAGRPAAAGTTPTAAPTQAAHRADRPAADPATGRTAATGAPTADPTQAAHRAGPAVGPAAAPAAAAAAVGAAARQPSWARPDDGTGPAGGFAGPYTVVVVDGDPGGADVREAMARLALEGPRAGIHVVCLAETAAASPTSPVTETYEAACAVSPVFRQCGAVALLSGDVATALRLLRIARTGASPGGLGTQGAQGTQAAPTAPAGPVGHGTLGTVDAVSLAWAERFARALAPLRTDGATGERHARVSAPLPQAARLLDELGLARATPASLMARWAAAADDTEALGGRAQAVLGAGPRGPVTVDLAAEGPHLLIEGPPGSGRTELLRALVASLASAERPDRLGIVLIDGRDSVSSGGGHGEGLRVCTDVPHVTTHLTANDPVRMREFAQSLSAELKRRAELLGRSDFAEWHTGREVSGRMVTQRTAAGAAGPGVISDAGDVDSPPSSTLRLRPGGARRRAEAVPPLPRLVVVVDDLDALVTPPLGSPGRPAAGSVMRALEAVAREGERLGVHLVAATGPGGRTEQTEPARRAALRVTLEAPVPGPDEPAPGRGRLASAEGRSLVFQGGRVTGRIPRTATLRPTVVPLEWHRMGDPPTRRPVRELGNGPTDLALLASALERTAREVSAAEVPSLL
ncbi:FHA domain-containing protein [Streptomyces sp. BB1-1-1]|uniref:FHA domain-containing protein n=1 Tax=Streptomyces sp. BB1-1-1 TaxID=3074430 RepID=UPI002877DCCE|nr:FHA domain-containing protein [Streptomyces sp. BB1-1-1]WND37264.1 FHA domain-containing protein [Streptomyces sp. BB1-1-1]